MAVISLGQWLASFSHRFSFQVELVRAVHESVEDGVGEGRIPDGVPIRLRQIVHLDGDDSWSRTCSIL